MREIRRSGLLLAVELGEPQKLYRIMELFKQAGILSDWFLFCDTAFRISPPLTISEEEIRGSAALILKCLDGNPLFSYYAGISRPRLPAIKHMRQLFSDDGACRP